MFEISLRNNKTFSCGNDTTILNAAKEAGIILEHSCLAARCRSCVVKVIEGNTVNINEELVLSAAEKEQGFILSCNSRPLSDVKLDAEDLGKIVLSKPRTLPGKINSIEYVSNDVLKIVLRLPPKSNFDFAAGQYVNIIKGGLKRSYSIANNLKSGSTLHFFVKKYENGLMSKYWFSEAKENDLLRIEGPLGTFFYREKGIDNIVFLATGTGIAPVKAILEHMNENPVPYANKKVWLFWGGRYLQDIFWEPEFYQINFKFIPVLSRDSVNWTGEKGYVQHVLLKHEINLLNSQVYACGSIDMIESARKILIENSLDEHQFYSDAFVSSN